MVIDVQKLDKEAPGEGLPVHRQLIRSARTRDLLQHTHVRRGRAEMTVVGWWADDLHCIVFANI